MRRFAVLPGSDDSEHCPSDSKVRIRAVHPHTAPEAVFTVRTKATWP